MRVSDVLFAVVVVILLGSLLSVWFYPSAQDFMESNRTWNGIKSFSSESGAQSVDSLSKLPSLPREHTLIVVPYVDPTPEELSRIRQFVDNGGSLLLMDDYGYGNNILKYLELPTRFDNRPLLDPLFSYKNQRMPRVTDFSPEIRNAGISALTLNHATSLINVEESQALAWSSSNSFLDTDGNEAYNAGEPAGPFPVVARFKHGQGTVTLVSDPSIMINSMVNRDDNSRFIKYLSSPPGAERPNTVLVDHSLLTKTPLDTSRTRLTNLMEIIRSPYSLLGIVALIFLAVSRYNIKRGESIG
ncbi:MAG: DUF4350 domain-containing protein [Chloroflexi bacterium]|nr:DUF4350 domain-containing protein [Chloroflexota bacterium]